MRTPLNLNVIVQNEPLRKTNGAEAQMDTSPNNSRRVQSGSRRGNPPRTRIASYGTSVGDFITDALNSEVPALAREVLESNVKDEENHDIALGYIANAYGVDPQAEKEALRLRTAWEAHPDHTITKAMVAERAIFFVLLPFFRFNGDAGMRTVSADISRDEQIHVAVNSLAHTELGYNISPSLDKLRKATINWVMQPLGTNTTDKYLDKKNFGWILATG